MKFLKSVFSNTIANFVTQFILFVAMPIANIISNQSQPLNKMIIDTHFIADIVISIFLVVLFRFCRKLFLEIEKMRMISYINGILSHYRGWKLYQGHAQGTEHAPNYVHDKLVAPQFKEEQEVLKKQLGKDFPKMGDGEKEELISNFYQYDSVE